MSKLIPQTPIQRLLHWVKERPNDIYFTQPIGSVSIEYSWTRVLDEVSRMANYLQQYPKGSRIAIVSLNCAHWVMVDLAIQMAGHISIPIYPTASKATIHKIIEHSEAKAVFLGKMFEPDLALGLLPAGLDVLAIYQPYQGQPYWDDLVKQYEPINQVAETQPNDLVSIVYTSGTTGDPKGVMISYRAVGAAMELIKSIIVINQQDRFVSYLPLAHVAERMAVGFGALYYGAHVSFIRSLDTFTEDVRKAAPTIFFGVPRIWTKIKMAIESKLGGPRVLSSLLRTPLLGGWLKRTLLKKLGFRHVRYALCAAAAVNKDVLNWFGLLGLKLNEAYGMTETCGLSHMTKLSDSKIGSVGEVINGCECMLSTEGEVLLRNPALMDGYYKRADLTAEVIDKQGWLHTGDLGEIDEEGYLYITGRVKDIFKTSKGKYIAPLPIEQRFQSALGIEHMNLMGNGFTQPFMVLSVFESDYAQAPKNLIPICEKILEKVNNTLETHEKISHVFISNEPWTIENGLLTPTLKMKRDAIEKFYQQQAERLMHSSNEYILLID
ncbi:MAG: AMP-binding protein [Marinicella sp.]|nr:AMP-binding protein [Xanthomonadales bacterium]